MPLQMELYKKFVETGICELGSSNGKFSQSALSIITSLKKLCNREWIVLGNRGVILSFRSGIDLREMPGESRWIRQTLSHLSGRLQHQNDRSCSLGCVTRRVAVELDDPFVYGLGKMIVLDYLLAVIKATSNDRVVLVSNYTQTLDVFEKLCQQRRYKEKLPERDSTVVLLRTLDIHSSVSMARCPSRNEAKLLIVSTIPTSV